MSTLGAAVRAYFHARIVATTGLPDASVLTSPRWHTDAANLPVAAVYSLSDAPVDPSQVSDRPHDRILVLAVELDVAGRGEEDATDALATQVRQAILTDGTLGGLPGVHFTVWAKQEWGAKETRIPESATRLLFAVHYTWRPDWS
jgi:hypothetical protein